MKIEDIEDELVTSVEKGLTTATHLERLEACGPNKLPEQKGTTILELLWAQINSMVIYILIIGAAISFGFDHLIDGCVIVGVVVINVGLGFYMERRAISSTDSLKRMMSPLAVAIRDEEKVTVKAIDLVPGDIIIIQPGDVAPADARIVKQSNLHMVEAALTGESHACAKDVNACRDISVGLADRKCMVFSGTQVIKGTATCIVTGTGAECEIGKISGLLAGLKPAKTSLLVQLEKFGTILSLVIIGFAFGTFGIAMARGYSVDESLNIAIGVAVAAIPEGLPSCITVTFAIGVNVMAGSNAIVKSLPAVETLGSVSVICSDKTGTLTENKMAVQRIARLDAPEIDTTQALSSDKSIEAVRCLLPGILCNDSTLIIGADEAACPVEGTGGDMEMANISDKNAASASAPEYTVDGDPTERCILDLAVTLMGAPQATKQLLNANPRLAEIPFDSATKYMATLHALTPDLSQLANGDGKIVMVKGAPEAVLAFCYPSPTSPESTSEKASWLEKAEGLAGQGMRVLALAYRVVPASYVLGDALIPSAAERFQVSCLVGIIDPPRAAAITAVAVAQSAGIVVKMITGDHPVTAQAVGSVLGLKGTRRSAVTGAELDEVMLRSMEDFDRVVLLNDVFARTTPEHKLRIVESLRRQGFVCSMTGDGVNDAPALKAANIGVAMGITGTEVAKDAANMIITDDNFATIVEAIRIGRCTYANLIKIIAFVLPTNGGQAFSIIAALIIGVAVPITALQILWVNMVTSVTLGVVLAFDKPDRSVLEDKPRRSDKPIFGHLLTWRVISVTTMLILAVLGIYRWELHRHQSQEYLRTCSVNTLVAAQIGYIFNCRDVRRSTDLAGMFGGNKFLYVGIALIIACQVLFTYAPPFQYVFETKPIDGESWGKIILLGVCVFLAVEADKWINAHRLRWLERRAAQRRSVRLERKHSFRRQPSSDTMPTSV